MPEPADAAFPKKGLSPLWVISLFLTFAESVLGVAVMQTQGGVQIALAAFVIIFPSIICGVFFFILWHKPYVLYPPADYGGSINVTQFVAAMKGDVSPQQVSESIVQKIEKIFNSQELLDKLEHAAELPASENRHAEIKGILDALRNSTENTVKQMFINFDSRPLLGSRGIVWEEPYNPNMTATQLLDRIWLHMQPHMPPFSYGNIWTLYDRDTGHVYTNLGRTWARKNGLREDNRSISSLGFKAGQTIDIVEYSQP